MPNDEMVLPVSRALALLLTIWTVVDLTYMPERLFALVHHLGEQAAGHYWIDYYLVINVFACLRIVLLFVSALMFWNCGPRGRRVVLAAPGLR